MRLNERRRRSMDATTERTSVEREIAISAAPETVWEFLVDPEKAVRWMGETATFDLRPGGLYRVGVIPGNTARGEFVEIDPPRRLRLTWGWEAGAGSAVAPGSTTIEFELVADGDGTLLRFSHRGLPDADAAARHAFGWEHYLARLALAAAGEDPGVDPWLDRPME
jgi:uncharacterized protein YndB with AHSA1/START domain